ncbi:MAG: M20 family metallopeptidase [Bacteroidota bacterium]|nr:M20 family metallopeptidase [Bacteroidota bacterium]
MRELKEKIKQAAKDYLPEIIAIRRHLHANPELSFEEYNTSAYICNKLTEYNIPFQKGIVKTGIVALLEGTKAGSKAAKPICIALRADMDALPINESNECEYRSVIPGVMHACGHDVHSASLLGVAMILNSIKDHFEGSIKFIFQPGEEKLPGGASLMIKEGVLENPHPAAIFAQHVFPSMETGKVGFRSGMYMASTDELYLTVRGKGGHAAMPAEYNNPLLIASQILLELDKEFMQKKHKAPTVLAFGKITGNGATNVIPEEVKIEGTFRTMNEDWRAEAHFKMAALAESIAEKMNGQCEFRIEKGYPFLVNDENTTNKAKLAAEEYLGKENVEELPLRMTAEDFSFYSQQVPACFYRLGTGNKAKGITSGVHTSTFDIDESALETGAGLMAWMTVNALHG